MRLLLRFIAVYTAASVLITAILILRIWHRGGIPSLLHAGAFGALTIAGWIATLAIGPPAALLLWKRQNMGRILTAVFYAAVCAYYAYLALSSPNGRISFTMLGSGLLTLFLLSPLARRACDKPTIDEQLVPQN
jgi:hypothetical protein